MALVHLVTCPGRVTVTVVLSTRCRSSLRLGTRRYFTSGFYIFKRNFLIVAVKPHGIVVAKFKSGFRKRRRMVVTNNEMFDWLI